MRNIPLLAEEGGIALLLPAFAAGQRRRRGGGDMAVAGGLGDLFERVGHADEFGVIPCATEELNTDRLVMIVVANREYDCRDAIRSARRVATTEARPSAATIVQADFA